MQATGRNHMTNQPRVMSNTTVHTRVLSGSNRYNLIHTKQRLTSWSCARFSFSLSICWLSSASASASLAFLGPTILMTRSYTSMARTHLHSPSHALDTFFTICGWKSLSGIYLQYFVAIITVKFTGPLNHLIILELKIR